jgi:hypothetical protein
MAVVQPYFDPTVLHVGGSMFGSYLESFLQERSTMNKEIMRAYLERMNPKALQRQQEQILRSITALELEKAKIQKNALQGMHTENAARLRGQYNLEAAYVHAGKSMATERLRSSTQLAKQMMENDLAAGDAQRKANKSIGINSKSRQGWFSDAGVLPGQDTQGNLASFVQKVATKTGLATGDSVDQAAVDIRVRKELQKAAKMKGAMGEEAGRMLAELNTQKRGNEVKFQQQYQRHQGNSDAYMREAKRSVSGFGLGPQRGGVDPVTGERTTARADTSSIDAQLENLYTQYNKLGEDITALSTKDPRSLYGPFQMNYMTENLFTKQHFGQGMLDAIQMTGSDSPYHPELHQDPERPTTYVDPRELALTYKPPVVPPEEKTEEEMLEEDVPSEPDLLTGVENREHKRRIRDILRGADPDAPEQIPEGEPVADANVLGEGDWSNILIENMDPAHMSSMRTNLYGNPSEFDIFDPQIVNLEARYDPTSEESRVRSLYVKGSEAGTPYDFKPLWSAQAVDALLAGQVRPSTMEFDEMIPKLEAGGVRMKEFQWSQNDLFPEIGAAFVSAQMTSSNDNQGLSQATEKWGQEFEQAKEWLETPAGKDYANIRKQQLEAILLR